MFLVDTNCWTQIARDRPNAAEVRQFLGGVPVARLFVSIYSVHSIGIILRRHQMIGRYGGFLRQMSIGIQVQVVDVPVNQLGLVDDACTAHNIDFDDAYQYVAAEIGGLSIVSLDADFDRTPRGRLTPAAALQRFRDEQQRQPQPPQQP